MKRVDFEEARNRLDGIVVETPLFSSLALKGLSFKLESLQKTGSFKLRGAYNALAQLPPEGREKGVVTSSSGNFAQGVAWAARNLNVSAKIVMMPSANPLKVERTRRLGAEVVFCEDRFSSRDELVKRIQQEEKRLVAHPFDHPHVVAGNGTISLEILESASTPGRVLVPISGGGLIAGVASALKLFGKGWEVWGVQPEKSNATYLSFHHGKRTAIARAPTIADGLRVTCPGEFTFPLIQQYVDRIVLVKEKTIRQAVLHFFLEEKLTVEPSGAVPLAAVLEGQVPVEGTLCLISGGNIAPDDFCELLNP